MVSLLPTRSISLSCKTQQPHLNVGREVANSIEKERAATGFFKASVFVPYRTSKSAYNMSEEFTFEQAFGER